METAPIEAFAFLKTFECEYSIQKLCITLGRSRKNTTKGKRDQLVNIELGYSKIISHMHAKLIFNFITKIWELHCFGQNGIKVDGIHYPRDSVLSIFHGAEVQIGDSYFIFLLPGQTKKSVFPSRLLPQKAQFLLPISKEVPTVVKPEVIPYDKPSSTYAQLIAASIHAQPERRANVAQIYDWIMENHPYYKYADVGWKSSIRHNLSSGATHKYFLRLDDNTKKAEYGINPEFEGELLNSSQKPSRKKKAETKNEPNKKKKHDPEDLGKEEEKVDEKSE
jgi:hypothetical protein